MNPIFKNLTFMESVSVNCTWCVHMRKNPENEFFCSNKDLIGFFDLGNILEALVVKDPQNHFCSLWTANQTAKEMVKKLAKESNKPKPIEIFDPFDL